MMGATSEQGELLALAERNQTAARALNRAARDMGLSGPEALHAFATALASIIDANVPPEQRIAVLNGLLAQTINEWAGNPPLTAVTIQ
jgi:hypothetical protein